jgi:glycosyltransferase involved in cell wall biosynthesis
VIAVIVVTDGRDEYLDRCVASLHEQVTGDIGEWWMHDDGGTPDYRAGLADRYPGWRHINPGPDRAGCAGAFQSVWRHLRDGTRADHIFLVEGDFQFCRPIDLDAMAGLLDERPYLAEVALRRQPWNDAEKAAGGIVELHPDWYTDRDDSQGRQWLEQRAFFTTNCPVFRQSLLDVPWPAHQDGCYSEGTFHRQLVTSGIPEVLGDQVRYAYWGSRDSGVWVQHIGHERAGKDY